MSATIRRDHIVDPVVGNRRPFAVHLDFVMVANHAALRRATVHEVTAGASAVVSVQLRIKLPMPPIVADPVISFLRHCAYTEEHGHHADCGYFSPNIRDHKAFPQWDKKTPSEPRFIDLTRWPLPGIECALPGAMIRRSGCHREPGNRIPLLSKCAPLWWGLAWWRAPI